MSGYELSRIWFNFCFENPEIVKPIHSAIFFFAIEHQNRLGGKDKFGFPSQMTMEAIGVKKYQTYGKALNELSEWGFIQFIEKSKNQYSANIIRISATTKNGKAQGEARGKALDKAIIKHGSKQGKSTGQSIGQSIGQGKDTVNKPINHITNKPINHITNNTYNDVPDEKVSGQKNEVEIISLNSKKKKITPSSGRPPNDHKELIQTWNDWFENKYQTKPIFKGGQDGKAVKDMIKHFGKIEADPIESLKAILTRWHKLDDFTQKQNSLSQIYNNLNSIITQLKKPHGREEKFMQSLIDNGFGENFELPDSQAPRFD